MLRILRRLLFGEHHGKAEARHDVEEQPHVQRAREQLRRVRVIEEIEEVERIARGTRRTRGHQ